MVQNTDIMPTILDMLNIPVVDNLEGTSIIPLIDGRTEKIREFIFAESAEDHFKGNRRIYIRGMKGKWRTMIVDHWKIIYIPHPEKDIFELYDLKSDPQETNNLIDTENEIASQMKKKILDFLKQQDNEGDVESKDIAGKARKLLIKAGYLEEDTDG